jgi:hypothetical protein
MNTLSPLLELTRVGMVDHTDHSLTPNLSFFLPFPLFPFLQAIINPPQTPPDILFGLTATLSPRACGD